MKNNFLFKFSLFTFHIIFTGTFNESTAQSKQSNPDVIFSSRKRTSPANNRINYPVWTKNQNNLPPGQAKKMDRNRNDRFDKNGNKKWNKQDRKRNEQGDHDNDHDNRKWNKRNHNRNDQGNEDRDRKEHHDNGHDD
jgi:hypothetical protein